MPRFLIERSLPGAGTLSDADLRAIACKSVEVLDDMGPRVQWHESYVTDEAITCLYVTEDPDLIREHARRGGFPCDTVREVRHVISPAAS
jgi:hypothetical protein